MTICSGVFGVLRIEETWRLWSKFLDERSGFEDWLKIAEGTAARPESSDVLYTSAKEELKKFEVGELPQRSATLGPRAATGPRLVWFGLHVKKDFNYFLFFSETERCFILKN